MAPSAIAISLDLELALPVGELHHVVEGAVDLDLHALAVDGHPVLRVGAAAQGQLVGPEHCAPRRQVHLKLGRVDRRLLLLPGSERLLEHLL
jgi:hypothetical protein